MHQIVCMFFKMFTGVTPRTPFGAVIQKRASSPTKSWLRAWSAAVLIITLYCETNEVPDVFCLLQY